MAFGKTLIHINYDSIIKCYLFLYAIFGGHILKKLYYKAYFESCLIVKLYTNMWVIL